MAKIRPLSNGQQLFLQKLLSRHVLSDAEARSLYESLSSASASQAGGNGMGNSRSLEHCLGTINASLVPGFGLEVRTVALDGRCVGAPPGGDEGEAAGGTPSSGGGRRGGGANANAVRYHAIVNKTPDDASKATFMSATHHGPSTRSPHEVAYLRLIVERLVERGQRNDEDGNNVGGANDMGAGCTGSLSRLKVLNLRTELEGPHEGKVSLQQAEATVSALVAEGWLVPTVPPNDDQDNDEEDEDDDEEQGEEDEDETIDVNAGKRKTKRRKRSSGGKGRKSLDGLSDGVERSHLIVGPRTYMELPDLLKDLGLEERRVPQFILHSAR